MATVLKVLNLSAPGHSHLTKVTQNIPAKVGDTVGAAPKSGRPKWTDLSELFIAGKLTGKPRIQRQRTGTNLTISTIMQACPEFAPWVRNIGGFVKDRGDLHRVTGQLRPMIGMSEQAWHRAQDRLGPQMATAALARVFEKH